LHIGVDAGCWSNDRGYGRFTREIVAAMAAIAPEDEFICFLDRASARRFSLSAPNVRTVCVDVSEAPSHAASHTGNRSIRDVFAMSRAVSREKIDVFFFPSVYTWFPLPPLLPAVVTLHDVIPERFPELTLPSARARILWWLKVRLALLQARRVLTVSEFSARDIARTLNVRRARISVASEAPSPVFVPGAAETIRETARKYLLPEGAAWFIYVGGFNPHKNVIDIVHAHASLLKELGGEGPYLLLVGPGDEDVFHENRAAIERAIADAGTERFVIWTGFVADEDLRQLDSGALALLLPSRAEGFGLPAIEAAACGTPVIATTESPLPELLEGGGIFVNPGEVSSLLSAMRRIVAEPAVRRTMGDIARRRAAMLTWAAGAQSAIAALHESAA
jgi:glycosyltransferase involved in cell wall biosynthesis